ncbi:NUT family member 1-like [Dasypus novemcinctus]|uniref:NUT family member 1-like n=1 Tax=Dasypus novemcinctus TaxID=9361 RepID=UPI0039C9762E
MEIHATFTSGSLSLPLVSIPKKSGSKSKVTSQRQRRHRRTVKTKAPKEIPPEAVKEYIDLMEGLVGPVHPAPEGEDGKWEEEEHGQQEDDGMYADPDLLSYIDQLCAEEDFITKVEAVIHPRFLAELLSPGAHVDFLSLTVELQQEQGLMPTQPSDSKCCFLALLLFLGSSRDCGEGSGGLQRLSNVKVILMVVDEEW